MVNSGKEWCSKLKLGSWQEISHNPQKLPLTLSLRALMCGVCQMRRKAEKKHIKIHPDLVSRLMQALLSQLTEEGLSRLRPTGIQHFSCLGSLVTRLTLDHYFLIRSGNWLSGQTHKL